MIVILLNIVIILMILIILLALYTYNCYKDTSYIKKCINSKTNLQIRVFDHSYTEGVINSNCLVGVKLGNKNIVYNCSFFKRILNIGPDYILVEDFSKDDRIQEALNSFLCRYENELVSIIEKV